MKKIILLSAIFLFVLVSGIKIASAADCSCLCSDGERGKAADTATCQAVCVAAKATMKSCNPVGTVSTPDTPQTLPNPLGITDINAFIARIINFVLSLVGSVSLLLFVYGGIIWMTSMGNDTKIKKGKDIVIWAVVGLAVVFFAYILVKFVIQGITG